MMLMEESLFSPIYLAVRRRRGQLVTTRAETLTAPSPNTPSLPPPLTSTRLQWTATVVFNLALAVVAVLVTLYRTLFTSFWEQNFGGT